MKIFLLVILLSRLLPSPQHDVPIAVFSLTVHEKQVALEIKMDKDDLERAITEENSSTPISKEQVKAYVSRHTSWSFNGKKQDLHFTNIHFDQEHYMLVASADIGPDSLYSIAVYNSCLIDIVDNHSNVVYLFHNNTKRGFRMHKGRTHTVIDL